MGPPMPETLSFGATTVGTEAAQVVVEGSSALCVACGSFCRRLRVILGSESVVISTDAADATGEYNPVDQMQRRREALLSNRSDLDSSTGDVTSLPQQRGSSQLQVRSAREVNLPI